jgi:DNA-binding NarL/FixJ family response regulator
VAGRPDLVIMDIGTKELDPAARIVRVSDYDDEAMRKNARHAGACAYVLKDNLLRIVSQPS